MLPVPSLPWLAPVVEQALAMPHAHALLLHGSPGDGAYACASTIAQAWLCEAASGAEGATRPCGHCEACRLFDQGLHPDVHRLLPEDLRLQLGVQDAEADGEGTSKAKRKPSRQIRIDEVRAAIDWIVTTSSRGRAKVVLIHPAEALNLQSANALLKTLEEPPRGARLLLTAAEPEQLLPTVRSRCQRLRLKTPEPAQARAWLQDQGLAQPEVLLAACAQRPLDALTLARQGVDAARWAALPQAVLAGQGAAAAVLAGWPLPRVLDALQKLCHDGQVLGAGGSPRFFPAAAVPPPRDAGALAAWGRALARQARHIDHPWNEGLLVESLLLGAQAAWRGETP